MVYPFIFRRLQPAIGFGWTVRVMAFVALALASVACGILCRKPGVAARKSRAVIDPAAFREPSFAVFAAALFLGLLAYFFPLFYITSFAMGRLHTSADFAFYLTSITNGASFVGRLLPVWLKLAGTEVPALNMLWFWTCVGTVLLFTWMAVTSVAGFVVWCVAWGVLSGAWVTYTAPAAAHPTLAPTLGQLGGRMGMAWAASGLGTLVGTPIAGTLVDVAASQYARAQALAGAFMAGASVLLLFPVWKARKHEREERRRKQSESSAEA